MPAVAVADDKSPMGALSSCRSAQKMPYIHPSSWAVRRISYTLVAGTTSSGKVTGYSQKRKLSIPFGLSATAKKDLRSAPSTLTNIRYFPSHLMAPAFNVAFIPIRSIKKGFVSSFRSYRQKTGVCAAVSTG